MLMLMRLQVQFILKVFIGVESESGLCAGHSSSSTPTFSSTPCPCGALSFEHRNIVMLEQCLSSSEGKLCKRADASVLRPVSEDVPSSAIRRTSYVDGNDMPGSLHGNRTEKEWRALDLALAVWDSDPQIKSAADYFAGQICKVFEYPVGGKDVSAHLMELHQGSERAADYAIKFHMLTTQSGWKDAALLAVFREGLNPALQAEMKSFKLPERTPLNPCN
ncbi:hypothetical protein QTP70_002587 [Hemibagrus guttatus]|uniref:Retrotransposon gag domain-containing protein n=1 Tax=Hemibagrus guttatus TaxID=175788 RepID=A0AAE0QWK2_9TELE|nr:hypothetical protein QTP70_002587 [Hemibagrus guttatus]